MSATLKRRVLTHEDLKECLRKHNALESIALKGFCEIPWRNISADARRIRQGFWSLLDDDPRRDIFQVPESYYPHDELDEEMEFGLLEKRIGTIKAQLTELERVEGRTTHDGNKWRFHFNYELLDYLYRHNALPGDYSEFFGACTTLNMAAFHIARALAALYDEANSNSEHGDGWSGSLLSRVEKSHAVTRLLRYESITGTKPDATPHRDRSAFTVHWLSSHPGLTLFNEKRERFRVNETSPTNILIFPAKKFWGITRGRHGTGTLHGVFDERRRDVAQVSSEHRFAIVSFVHAILYPEDAAWMRSNIGELQLDPANYRL